MPKQNYLAPINVQNFIGGLVTDSNPLTFPSNATIDERNMLLNKDGTRKRRLGMGLEADYVEVDSEYDTSVSSVLRVSTFKWENVGGITGKTFEVVAIGSKVSIFDTASRPLSGGLVFELNILERTSTLDFSAVDGMLVIASGSPNLHFLKYDPATQVISEGTYRLLTRDIFGLEDVVNGKDLRVGNNLNLRPGKLTKNHLYNLRNQTFAIPRLEGGPFQENVNDPILTLKNYGGSYPSNADSVLDAFYPNTESFIDPTANRFNPKELEINAPGAFAAPIGYFIIDVLDRGDSRVQAMKDLYRRYFNKLLGPVPQSYNKDSTPGGATVLAQYAGRMFYAGFSNEVLGPDAHSPYLGSYVFFSQLVTNPSDLKACYQKGDPTSRDKAELLATDGGFVKIDGAHNIVGMATVPRGLLVIAENGIWLISGETEGQFKATSYMVTKISSKGCDSPGSIVSFGDAIAFWCKDGIMQVSPNQYGDMTPTSLSDGKISYFFDRIPDIERITANGAFDAYDSKLRWVYGPGLDSTKNQFELVYNLDFQAFTVNEIEKLPVGESHSLFPIAVAPIVVPTYIDYGSDETVVVGSDVVLVGTEEVVVSGKPIPSTIKEIIYLVITGRDVNNLKFSFAAYNNQKFVDWEGVEIYPAGVDAKAYMLTGWLSGGDTQRRKEIPFFTMHFYKTETGFVTVGDDFDLVGKSSCIVQAQWAWANHPNSGRWGTPFQAYRLGRPWRPENVSDTYDNGYYTVVTRNKLRGSGPVVSLLMSSEPERDMQIIGWNMMVGMNQYE